MILMSRKLTSDEIEHLEWLSKELTVVLVSGKRANAEGLFVVYQLPLVNAQLTAPWSQSVLEEYFVNQDPPILYLSAKSKFATEICFEALRDLSRFADADLTFFKRALSAAVI